MISDWARDAGLPVAVGVGVWLAFGLARWGAVESVDTRPKESQTEAMCGGCHSTAVEAWASSHHAEAQVLWDSAKPIHLNGEPVDVVGRIGVDPLVQWLVQDDGRVQVTQQAELVATGEHFDVFADGRVEGEWGHWTGGGMTWNRNCATCHGTDVRKGWDGSSYVTTMSADAVSCAACHGNLASHEADPEQTTTASVDGCAPCHARRAELTEGYEVGADFLSHFAPVLIDGVPDGLMWADGQIRDEVFEWTAFASSRMHDAGVRCVDCHEPHSGELRRPGDALCLGCHQALPGFVPHDRHAAPLTCADCHMPTTTYMQKDPRHDHGFRLPDPVTAAALGLPDACSRCHEDRDMIPGYTAWYGAGTVDLRAKAFAEEDAAGLLEVLATTNAMWRASAAVRLADVPPQERVLVALRAASEDSDPLVRFGAVTALGRMGAPVSDALRDPVRAVRVAASRGFQGQLRLDDPMASSYLAYLSNNADQPEALVERGAWRLVQGDVRGAIVDLEAALRLDPRRVSTLDALAVALSTAGRGEEAVARLEQAIAIRDDDGVLWGRLGLARAAVGDVSGALAALQRAADREAPRARYSLGLLLAERGDYADALRALFAAEQHEDGPDVRYAIATTLWQWGRKEEARIAAKRVLQLDPVHAGALQLLRL